MLTLLLGFMVTFYGISIPNFSIFCFLTIEISYILIKLVFKYYLRLMLDEVGIQTGLFLMIFVSIGFGMLISKFNNFALYLCTSSFGAIFGLFLSHYIFKIENDNFL